MRETYQYGFDRAMTHGDDDDVTLDKAARGCNTRRKIKKEETMTMNRRDLALSTLAVSALAVSALALTTPALAASADEDAVAKKVEAFRLAQIAADPKALGALCWDDLSYSHSSGKVEDKATFIANATDGKSKIPVDRLQGPHHQGRRSCSDRALPLAGRTGDGSRREESIDQPSHPDELAEAGRRVEAPVAGSNEVVINDVILARAERRGPRCAIAHLRIHSSAFSVADGFRARASRAPE
ncbi:hypothetical protein ABIF95_003028 [Bradyrhizobium ottawaense]